MIIIIREKYEQINSLLLYFFRCANGWRRWSFFLAIQDI